MKPIYLSFLIFITAGFLNASAAFTAETWTGTTSSTNPGDWDTATNWSPNSTYPNSGAYEALFNSTTGLDTSVNVSSNTTVGFIYFNGAPSYTIGTSSTATLTLDGLGTNTTQLNSGANTETFSGNVVIQDTGGTSFSLNLSTGTVVFNSTSNLTLKTNVSENSSGGALTIAGTFSFGSSSTSNLTLNFNKPGTSALPADLVFAPTSASYTGTTTLTDSAQYSKIDIQTNTTSGLSALVVGGGSATYGAIYIGGTGISVGTTLGLGPTNTSIAGGTYTFGMDSASAATGTFTGAVTLNNKTGSTGTDDFDVAANNTLTISGAIADSAATTSAGFTVTKTSTGTLVLSSPTGNSYTNATQVNAGTVLLGNGSTGSATGTGALSVANGATIGGITTGTGRVGTSTPTTFAIGTSATGVANVIVGNGVDATSSLGLAAPANSSVNGTFTNANLNFNLDSTSTNANLLDLGSTNVNFATTTLALNVLNASVIAPNTAYTLVTDAAGFNSATDGLVVANGMITSGLTIAPNSLFGAENANGMTTGFYDGSYLFISADDKSIEVEVVPEPSTTAELLSGGLLLLGFVLRRRLRVGRGRP